MKFVFAIQLVNLFVRGIIGRMPDAKLCRIGGRFGLSKDWPADGSR